MDYADFDIIICASCKKPIEGNQSMISTVSGVYHGGCSQK